MPVASSDLLNAINDVWDASALDASFRALWSDPTDAEFPVLHDQEAGGGQPFPYCVFEMQAGSKRDRMSGSSTANREVRDVPVNFRIHAREIAADSRTPKEIASDLAEAVMQTFGGHPTVAPTGLSLDNGNHLITQYVNDYCIRTGQDNYQWIVSYVFRIEVPVRVA